MPELKHHFAGGKMNLDLDERLVPNGEYRKAFNIQVSSSEGSNVGVLQNLLSNEKVLGQSNTIENENVVYHCIGSIAEEKNDALYWFVKPEVGSLFAYTDFFNFNPTSPQLTTYPVDNLFDWTPYTGTGFSQRVKTLVGQDMIIQYARGAVRPVVVDQFEVVCGNKDSQHSLPTYPSGGNPWETNGEIKMELYVDAWNAVEVGWNLEGYTKGTATDGSSSQLTPTSNIEITSKYIDDNGDYYIGLKNTYNFSPPINTSFNSLYNDISNFGAGPQGFVKAFYFKNNTPALNFRRVKHITGVNVIDDMMFWTDGYDEPKKINITRSINGTEYDASLPTYLLNDARNIDKFDKIRLEKDHVTVIKKSPNNPPALQLVTGREIKQTVITISGVQHLLFESYAGVFNTGGNHPTTQTDDIVWLDVSGSGTQDTSVRNLSGVMPGSEFLLNITENSEGISTATDHLTFKWDIGDTVVFKEFDQTNTDQPPLPLTDYSIKGEIISMSNSSANSTPTNTLQVTIRVSEVSETPAVASDISNGELRYVIDKFDEDKNIFEFKYPRFAYRYKYEDNEYSHFSPFTEPAFIPGALDYHPKKGWNLGMANRIEYIVVKNFKPDDIPLDVVEVDILYKDDLSPNIYVIDTIKADAQKDILTANWADNHPLGINFGPGQPINYWQLNAYKITDEQIKYVLPSNQLLRIYDNVPRRANAQDITGNRIVYGNYLQNFDLIAAEFGNPSFNPSIIHSIIDGSADFGWSGIFGTYEPLRKNSKRSIKSLREYQLGVVFIDEFGRETPVLSNRTSTFKVSKNLSDQNNKLQVGTRFSPPSGNFAPMKYFKFFIKETSGEYYNMAMDRWYDAKDGNVWMSFPSSDVNKLTIDSFLILKKAAETNESVAEHPARYKVLAIENEAPDYIKTTYTLIDNRSHGGDVFNAGTLNIPRSGISNFELNFQEFYNTSASNLHTQFQNKGNDDFYVQFELLGALSKKYKISSITSDIIYDNTTGIASNLTTSKYYIKTSLAFTDEVNMILDDPTGVSPTGVLANARMRLFRAKPENKPEFDGRFFVKIFTDDIFEKYIKSAYDPINDANFLIGPELKFYYMNDEHHLMHGGGIRANSTDFQDGNGSTYHPGTGFPKENEVNQWMYDLLDVNSPNTVSNAGDRWLGLGPWTGSTSYTNGHKMDNAYSASRHIGGPHGEHNGTSVKLGLRHFAAFFRNYEHAGHGTNSVGYNGGHNDSYTNYDLRHNGNAPASGNLAGQWNKHLGSAGSGALDPEDCFSWIYKFQYGTTSNDTRWREEYNNYTTIPWKSFDPMLGDTNWLAFSNANLGTSYTTTNVYGTTLNTWSIIAISPFGSQYGIAEKDLLWDTWWRTDGLKKRSDDRARDSEVWYMNEGRFAGREYHTNNKQWISLYGASRGYGIKPQSNEIIFDLTLGGLYGEPIDSMDGTTGMNDPDFFEIGKSGGNSMYQDQTTVNIVSQLKPGSYFKLKEDPTDSMYQIVSVTEKNLYNYARTSKGDSNQGGWLNAAITNNNGTPKQSFHGLGDGSANNFVDWTYTDNLFSGSLMVANKWFGDWWCASDVGFGLTPNTISNNFETISAIGLFNTEDDSGNYIPQSQGYINWSKNNSHGSQLSCNYSKMWRIRAVNIDEANPTLMQWNPTGSNTGNFGPITNGTSIDISVTESVGAPSSQECDLISGAYGFYTDSIVNTAGDTLQQGMILTHLQAAGPTSVDFDEIISSSSDHSSKLYLQVGRIVPDSTHTPDGFFVELVGYIRPLTVNDTHVLSDSTCILTFKQAKMNGYSLNSVNKISANTKWSPFYDTATTGGGLQAIGYTLQFLIPEEDGEAPLSDNPAVWETEPEDGPELDIYYEASPRIPIKLEKDTSNDWIPTRYSNNSNLTNNTYPGLSLGGINQKIHNPYGSYSNSVILTPFSGPYASGFLSSPNSLGSGSAGLADTYDDFLEIVRVDGDILTLRCDKPNLIDAWVKSAANGMIPAPLDKIINIGRPDGIIFKTKILAHNIATTNTFISGAAGGITDIGGLEPYVDWADPNFGDGHENCFRIKITDEVYGNWRGSKSGSSIHLNWYNCYSFGNGVESNRIRDNYNTPFISNGVRVSTTFADYAQEERKYGLIYSGIYNSTSGVNSLNQFIQAEKITKDVNPMYGSIQKLHSRDTDLVTFCEDKVLKILANKDAVFNADGNPQLTANQNVLGQTIPFVGEYGISRNPESFASESYRAYFTDKVRGAVLRLSKDGLTPISDAGMKDWFKDNLKKSESIIGSYDDKKDEYNVSLRLTNADLELFSVNQPYSINQPVVVSYDERVKGWTSFKTFGEMESGVSMANNYYTFKNGMMWMHHSEEGSYNTFYGQEFVSEVNVLLNDEPSVVKSFKTIGYEGSESKIPNRVDGTNTTEDLYTRKGWYSYKMTTDLEVGSFVYFTEKEGKWFSRIKGTNKLTDVGGSIIGFDTSSFANQGIGRVSVGDITYL